MDLTQYSQAKKHQLLNSKVEIYGKRKRSMLTDYGGVHHGETWVLGGRRSSECWRRVSEEKEGF